MTLNVKVQALYLELFRAESANNLVLVDSIRRQISRLVAGVEGERGDLSLEEFLGSMRDKTFVKRIKRLKQSPSEDFSRFDAIKVLSSYITHVAIEGEKREISSSGFLLDRCVEMLVQLVNTQERDVLSEVRRFLVDDLGGHVLS